MIDQKRVQDAVAMVSNLTDDEQEAVYEQLHQRHEERRRQELHHRLSTQIAQAKAGTTVRTYDPATGTFGDPEQRSFRFTRI
jgi:hypothetical protein